MLVPKKTHLMSMSGDLSAAPARRPAWLSQPPHPVRSHQGGRHLCRTGRGLLGRRARAHQGAPSPARPPPRHAQEEEKIGNVAQLQLNLTRLCASSIPCYSSLHRTYTSHFTLPQDGVALEVTRGREECPDPRLKRAASSSPLPRVCLSFPRRLGISAGVAGVVVGGGGRQRRAQRRPATAASARGNGHGTGHGVGTTCGCGTDTGTTWRARARARAQRARTRARARARA